MPHDAAAERAIAAMPPGRAIASIGSVHLAILGLPEQQRRLRTADEFGTLVGMDIEDGA